MREMTSSNCARDKAKTQSVATRSLSWRKSLVLVALVFTICTTACDGIGSWRKSSTTKDTDDTNDSSSNKNNIDNNMNKTYLDLFGESAKEFLTQKAPEKIKTVFPATDENCKWDWKYVRCEPYCECSFQPKLPGDFHLGRACRKRSNFGQRNDDQSESEDDETETKNHFEEMDERYRSYCVIETNGERGSSSSGDSMGQQRSSPPPPSIPSPFPFLAKSGKATYKILRTKADPVVARAVDEFETIHGKVQAVVCQDLKTRCDGSEMPRSEGEMEKSDNNDNASASMEVAWQERLFCRNMIRECRENFPR